MSGRIATLNAGSSSIKFALYEAGPSQVLLMRGQVRQIGVSPNLQVVDAHGNRIAERRWPAEGFDHQAATRAIIDTIQGSSPVTPVSAIGHRVVHGGAEYAAPVRIDQATLAALARLSPLAPLHQPHNLAPIEAIAQAEPHLPQVACFDTAFHRTQPALAQMFAIPRKFTEAGVRRYGFH